MTPIKNTWLKLDKGARDPPREETKILIKSRSDRKKMSINPLPQAELAAHQRLTTMDSVSKITEEILK